MTIPKDIAQAARECVRESFADPLSPMQGYVARAILAERQHCAEVAKKVAEDAYGDTSAIGAAALIRGRILV